ncbi:MAG: hypothetical protein WCP18_00990 [bacterium]
MHQKLFPFIFFGLVLVATTIFTAEKSTTKIAQAQFSIPLISAPTFNDNGTPNITVQDLADAGFTNVQQIASKGQRFNPPIIYFITNESISWTNKSGKMENSNITSVSVAKINNKSWIFNGSLPQTLDTASLHQIKDSKAGYYFVITGPDQAKIATLMANIKSKF